MWLEIAALVWIGGQIIYHRLTDEGPAVPKNGLNLPSSKKGGPVPYIYGRVRQGNPALVRTGDLYIANSSSWHIKGNATNDSGLIGGIGPHPGSDYKFCLDMFFVVGIPFYDGFNRIHRMYAGDVNMVTPAPLVSDIVVPGSGISLEELTGNGNHESPASVGSVTTDYQQGAGLVEWLNGSDTQEIVDPITGDPKTFTADRLSTQGDGVHTPDPTGLGSTPPERFPSYRHYMSVFLFNGHPELFNPAPSDFVGGNPVPYIGYPKSGSTVFNPFLRWIVGPTPNPPAYSFVVSSLPNFPLYMNVTDAVTGYDHANPADVLWDLLKSKFGKAGISQDSLDFTSFSQVAYTLHTENHGMSIIFDQKAACAEMISDVLKQIDGIIYQDPADSLIKLKLVRADYNPTNRRVIHEGNCSKLQDVSLGGWTGLPNKIVVNFTNSRNHWQPGTSIVFNNANSVGQDGEVVERILNFPGIPYQELADKVALRELAALSRPTSRFRATVDESFADAVEGDVFALQFPKINTSGLFRVGGVTRGTLDDGSVVLELIQEYFYVYREEFQGGPGDIVLPPQDPVA